MVLLPAVAAACLLAGPDAPDLSPRAAAVVQEATRLLSAAAAREPDIEAVQRAAAARAAVPVAEAESWRGRARIAGMLPRLSAEYRHDDRTLYAQGVSSGQEMDYIRATPDDQITVRLDWNLDGLVFGRSELAAAAAAQAAAGRRLAAVEHATRLYYERLRLRVALAASPPKTPQARAEAEIELAGVTAQLHALTGLYAEELR